MTEGSVRKNSLGIKGAKALLKILINNKALQVLKLQDNDLGTKGAETLAQALRQNRSLKSLKLAENNIRYEGAEAIMRSAFTLESLDLGKNFISYKIGPTLQFYLETAYNLRELNLEFNELEPRGIEYLAMVIPTQLLVGLAHNFPFENNRALEALRISKNSR